ncbi:MAG: hypothetical protein IIX28_00480 [Clostridia bacterium]|nr:hypothetical protein [Clostridia bacterium]
MKKYWKELTALVLQLFMFYIFPLFAGPTDAMGMVFLILCSAVLLGFLLGVFASGWKRFLYPVAISLLFIPSVAIYYNESAFVHALWYLVASAVGLAVGASIRFLFCLVFPRK